MQPFSFRAFAHIMPGLIADGAHMLFHRPAGDLYLLSEEHKIELRGEFCHLFLNLDNAIEFFLESLGKHLMRVTPPPALNQSGKFVHSGGITRDLLLV